MIDWLAVDMVCTGERMVALKPVEKKMVMRRLAHKMNDLPSLYANGITVEEVARRLGLKSKRQIERLKADLPAGVEQTCPVCREPMWVVEGVVEAHGNRIFEECEMSRVVLRRGLAAVRPDLYRWIEGVA